MSPSGICWLTAVAPAHDVSCFRMLFPRFCPWKTPTFQSPVERLFAKPSLTSRHVCRFLHRAISILHVHIQTRITIMLHVFVSMPAAPIRLAGSGMCFILLSWLVKPTGTQPISDK